jgi:S-adenosylmethionine:tRNA ribosyltransferase-isomerase
MKMSDLAQFDYVLPEQLIRKVGIEPRDSAKLFVYDTKTDTITHDVFRNLADYVPENTLIVLNKTRVLPARLWLKKETGGKIEVFVLVNQLADDNRIPVLVDRKVVVGQELFFPDGFSLTVVDQNENIFYVALETGGREKLFTLLDLYGETPVPHYLEDDKKDEETLRIRYQTIFAESQTDTGASVAAPTASLHFTDAVFESLSEKGIGKTTLTLNVGLGTFAPLCESAFETGKLHQEYVTLPEQSAEKINKAKQASKKILSVGTTTTRSLEACTKDGKVSAYSGMVDIFIYPPYQFQAIDMMLTNFHLPKTSLMLLVEALLREKKSKKTLIELYQEAIEHDYAFYSFGDSMLIL